MRSGLTVMTVKEKLTFQISKLNLILTSLNHFILSATIIVVILNLMQQF